MTREIEKGNRRLPLRAHRRRHTAAIAIAAVALTACLGRSGNAQAASSLKALSFSRSVLPNGLVVLVSEDHTAPVVAVDVWYHIGTKNDPLGHSGFAHLCEHLMGEGSPNEPLPEQAFIQSIGGTSARWALTTEDVTHYYATVPSNELETMLWLESDRMASPLSRADDGHFASVLGVVKQERLQQREVPLFGASPALTLAAVFPAGHPYGADPSGSAADLNAATAGGARAFCLPYYAPNDAVVSVSGDVSAGDATALIRKYFGGIPRGALPARIPVPRARLGGPTRQVLEDPRARTPQLRLAWPTVGFTHPDRLALDALASILSRERTGRLTKLLVFDLGLATRVSAANFNFEEGGLFQIDVTPRPNASLTRIEELVDSVVASLKASPPGAEEVEAFARGNAVAAIASLQTRAARADTLAHGEVFAHDPAAYAKQVSRTFAVTGADVSRAARAYLTDGRVVMSMVPAGKLDLVSKPDLSFTNVTPARTAP